MSDFVDFLEQNGMGTLEEWRARYLARVPEAHRVHLLWLNRIDDEPKASGELPIPSASLRTASGATRCLRSVFVEPRHDAASKWSRLAT